jgi:hypothetical protein
MALIIALSPLWLKYKNVFNKILKVRIRNKNQILKYGIVKIVLIDETELWLKNINFISI